MSEDRERVERIRNKEVKWKKVGKGKGNRWLMLRDTLAILSLRPMTNIMIQDTMFLHRGLKRSTIREFIDQLERTKSVEQIQENIQGVTQWYWRATEPGVSYWIGTRMDIPASIVQVANTMKYAPIFEESINET